jgi:hypothetical protein
MGKTTMTILGRDAILAAADLAERKEVQVPEWGGTVLVRMLSGKERDRIDELAIAAKGKGKSEVNMKNFRARLVAACICDAEGKRVFPESDIDALGDKSAAALDRVFEVAAAFNRISKDDIDELVGNSEGDQSA